MGQAESNESAAVKRQAEGGEVPMYKLLDLSGIFIAYIQQSFYVIRYCQNDAIEIVLVSIQSQHTIVLDRWFDTYKVRKS